MGRGGGDDDGGDVPALRFSKGCEGVSMISIPYRPSRAKRGHA